MKKILKSKSIICLLSIMLILLTCTAFSTQKSNVPIAAATSIEPMDNEQINSAEYLYSLNGNIDFIYVIYDNGYAIYFIGTMELMEYSPQGRLPFKLKSSKKYYCGPGEYYEETDNGLKNIITNAECTLNALERDVISLSIKAKLLQTKQANDTEYIERLNNHNAIFNYLNNTDNNDYYMPDNPDELEDVSGPNIDGAKYIENYQYFSNDPKHGTNTLDSCAAVATQLLLSYNNYYNDRRIIADKYLNGWNATNNEVEFPELNPNFCTDPVSQTSQVLGTSGDNEQLQNTYYNYVYQHIPSSSNMNQVRLGLTSILDERNAEIENAISYNVTYMTNLRGEEKLYSNIIDEIQNNRPVIVGLSSSSNGHAVVAYGYQEKHGTQGLIAHYGWNKDYNRKWVNYLWCTGAVALKINHTHNYNQYDETLNGEIRCSVCNHRSTVFITETSGGTIQITGVKMPIDGQLTIPKRIEDRLVTWIGNAAFANQSELSKITIPNSVLIIGANAFENCEKLAFALFEDNSWLCEMGNSAFYNTGLTLISIPKHVREIPTNAFAQCPSLTVVAFETDSELKTIGNSAFYNCSNLIQINIPSSCETIGANAFENANLMSFETLGEVYSLQSIGNSAFANSHIKNVCLPYDLTSLGYNAFYGCEDLCSAIISKNIENIGSGAFTGCNKLTIYTDSNNTQSGWISGWNGSDRPIVLSCLIAEGTYITAFEKTLQNPFNVNAINGINNPFRKDYTFGGWYTTSDFTGTKYDDIISAPYQTLYAKWIVDEKECIATGTLITLADGSQKAVEQLTGNEMLLVWDMVKGEFSIAPILFIDHDPLRAYEVVNLYFADGTIVKIIGEHGFWDFTLNKYVYLDKNAFTYVGHYFNKQTTGVNGEIHWSKVQLTNIEIQQEYTEAWSPITYGHFCYYVNGMLSMPGGISGFINIFDVNEQTLKIDEQKMADDINNYGLFTYEEFSAIFDVPQIMFDAMNGQYLKVAIGKGLINYDNISKLIERYSVFF